MSGHWEFLWPVGVKFFFGRARQGISEGDECESFSR